MTYTPPKRASLPPPHVPMVAEDGTVTPDWYQFLLDQYQYSGMAGAKFPMWRTVALPGQSWGISNTLSQPGYANSGPGNFTFYSFISGSDFYLETKFALPSDYVPGSDLYAFVRWFPSNTDTGSCDWNMSVSPSKVGSVTPSPVSVSLEQAGGGTAYVEQVTSAQLSHSEGVLSPGDLLIAQLNRLGSSDAFTGAALLGESGFFYQAGPPGTIGRV